MRAASNITPSSSQGVGMEVHKPGSLTYRTDLLLNATISEREKVDDAK